MEQGDEPVTFKRRVKKWLKSHRLDYKWMASQCGVSEITVRNWMSKKNIPPLKEQLIERVMIQLPTPEPAAQQQSTLDVEVQAVVSLTIKLTPSIYHDLESKAQQQNTSLNELISQAITSLIEEAPPQTTLPTRKVILPPQT